MFFLSTGQRSFSFQLFIFFLCYTLIVLPISPSLSLAAGNISATKLTAGIDKYQDGSYQESIALLKAAKADSPKDYAVPMYLGLAYMQLGNIDQAIVQLERSLSLDPGEDAAKELRRSLTLLKKEKAKAVAKKLAAGESAIGLSDDADTTLAVYPPENLGDKSYENLGRGLSGMLIHDLSQLEKFTVLERVQIQTLIDEQVLGETALVKEGTAAKAGKLLGAGKIIPGTFSATQQSMEIRSSIIETTTGGALGIQIVRGELKDFWELEKALAFSILKDLGIEKNEIPGPLLAKIEKVHTKNFTAFSAYSAGLAASDKEDYVEAKKQFEKAVEEDPDFELAELALLALPVAAFGVAAIIMGLESSASGAVATSTTAAGSVGSGAAATSTASAGTTAGLSGTTWAAIGVGAAVTVGVAASAGGGSSGSEPSNPCEPFPQCTLTGASGEVRVNLTWDNTVDLDLYCTDPCNQQISFLTKSASCQGFTGSLDVDSNSSGSGLLNPNPAENIVWPDGAPSGSYTCIVDYFSSNSTQEPNKPTSYSINYFYGEDQETLSGSLSGTGEKRSFSFSF